MHSTLSIDRTPAAAAAAREGEHRYVLPTVHELDPREIHDQQLARVRASLTAVASR